MSKKNKNRENIHIYDSLRSEILLIEELQRNIWIAMYASYLTLFVVALEWSYYIFLLTYMVLIPFQSQILRYRWSIRRMSEYIIVFFEQQRKDMHWETFHNSDNFKKYYKKFNKNLASIFSGTGVIQLGGISTITLWGFIINRYVKGLNITWVDILCIILSLFCMIIIIILNRQYNKGYGNDVSDIVKEYKDKIDKS